MNTTVNGRPAGVATGLEAGRDNRNPTRRWPSWALLPTSTPHEERRFWRSYLTVTFAVQAYLSVVLIIYLTWASDGGSRELLTGIGLLSLALSVTGILRSRWLASRAWRSGFWLSWMCGSIVTMGVASHLDGGVESPLLFLPVLPVMSAMLGLAPQAVAMCAGLSIVTQVAVFVTDDNVSVTNGALMMLSSLVLAASVLAVTSSLQRARLESGQSVLLAELADSNARLITAQERAHIGTLEVGPDGRAWGSDELLRMLGISRDVPISKDTFWDHLHPDDLKRVRESFLVPAERGQTVDIGHRLVRSDGQIRDVHSWATTTVDSSRPKLVATVQDVTELRAVERMKEEFLSVMGHELRTPLTSIRGALGLLAGGALGPLSAKAQRMADVAMSSSDRLIRLINDILDVERISAGKVMLQLRSCSADEVVRAAVSEMTAVAAEGGISLQVGGLTGSMLADRDRVLQTLVNLLGNAVKFSSTGSRITVTAGPAEGMVAFTIVDHGRGVPAGQREAVFDRFRQVDASDAREKGGTGLGLAICKGIVEEHGGRIWVTETPGGGATFSFTMPAEQPKAEPPGTGAAVRNPDPKPSSTPLRPAVTGSALICDDDPDFVEVMTTLLHTHGYATVSAYSGAQAVELAVRDRPAVIVLDLMMPGMSGWDTLAELHRHPETVDIPVLILTALGPQEILDPRVSGWVSKTAGSEELLRTLRHALGTDAPPTVLVVEDDNALAQVLAAVFEGHGANTVVTGKGRDAVALTSRIVPDLLVLDVGLPDMDGFAVVDALRRNAQLRSVPLVVYSGVDLSEADRTRLRLGETRFLAKGRTSSAEFEHQVLGLLDRIAPAAGGAALPTPTTDAPVPPA